MTGVQTCALPICTGKVLAMANMPTYDPSNINTSDVSVFNNDTISHPYEAGSDVKTFTVATGIDKGVISPQSTYNNTGKIKVEDITINNASKNNFLNGDITMQTALNQPKSEMCATPRRKQAIRIHYR